MLCASCGHRNRDGARFCAACAAPLSAAVACPACGAAQPAGARFCDGCGAALAATAPAGRAAPAVRDGERKQVTVLFADVRGSMELAEQLDPEAWQLVMDRFFAILSAGVRRFEGTVDKFTGDGVMAVFGAPMAHEDHARRACLAALDLQRELAAYAAELRARQGLELGVRMGLNSGEVVVGAIGEDGGSAWTALGHPVGLAQRMEQLAAPGAIYLTERTAALVAGHVALRDLGELEVKGVRRPLRVHELTGLGPGRGRLDVARARGFTRFVGREDELRTLERACERAFAGHGQVVGVVGEAGVGKSRLCHEFLERRRAAGTPVLHVSGQPHARLVPMLPVLALLRAYFGIEDRDAEGDRARQGGSPAGAARRGLRRRTWRCSSTCSRCPTPSGSAPRMDPEARQRHLLALTRRLFAAESRREPGVTVVEDLHWLDPASEVFLAHQVEAAPGTRSLLVVNFRPEHHAAWMSRSHYAQIALAPLGDGGDRRAAGGPAGRPPLGGRPGRARERADGRQPVLRRGGGAVAGRGRAPGRRARRLPPRRRRSPTPRCRPASRRRWPLASTASSRARRRCCRGPPCSGREFDVAVLERVAGLEPEELEGALGRLVAGELVQERAAAPGGPVRLQAPADPGGGVPLAARRAPRRPARRRRPARSPRSSRGASTSAPGSSPGTGRRPARTSRRRGGTRARPCGPGRRRRRRRWRTGAGSGSSPTGCPRGRRAWPSR